MLDGGGKKKQPRKKLESFHIRLQFRYVGNFLLSKLEIIMKRRVKSPLRPLVVLVFCFLTSGVVAGAAAAVRFGRVDAAVSSTGFAPVRPGLTILK